MLKSNDKELYFTAQTMNNPFETAKYIINHDFFIKLMYGFHFFIYSSPECLFNLLTILVDEQLISSMTTG